MTEVLIYILVLDPSIRSAYFKTQWTPGRYETAMKTVQKEVSNSVHLTCPHQQTLLRLLGAPEHWDSIGPSRSDQQCHFLVRSSQESHDLSGASSPFQEWLEVLDLPDCI